MANKKISELPFGDLTPSSIIPIVSNTVTSQTTFGEIVNQINNGLLPVVTKSELDALVSTSGLTVGKFYKIDGVDVNLYGGTSIVLQAITSSKLSKEGNGIFYNPKYNEFSVWTNVGTLSFDSQEGVFDADENIYGDGGQVAQIVGIPGTYSLEFIPITGTFEAGVAFTGSYPTSTPVSGMCTNIDRASIGYNVGDKVIFGGKVWVNISGTSGTTINEVLGSGNTSNTFNLRTKITGIVNTSFSITDGVEVITCDNNNNLEGNLGGGGYIDDISGYVYVYFGAAPANGALITASYDFGPYAYKFDSWPESEFELDGRWEVVPYNETDYNMVIDSIEYEYEHDNISYRKNEYNEVTSEFWNTVWNWGYSIIKAFPWGNDNVWNTSFKNSYLHSLVNFNGSYMENIIVKQKGGFNAHYWGRDSQYYNITLDEGAHMVSMNVGYNNQIFDIKLGQNARISSIYLSDNNQGQYERFSNIDMASGYLGEGVSTYIENVHVYPQSSFYSIVMESGDYEYQNSYINNIVLIQNSGIFNIKMNQSSRLENIWATNYGRMRDIEIGRGTYISNISIYNSGDIFNVKLNGGSNYNWGNYSYISNVSIGQYGYFHDVNVGLNSYINNVDMSTNGNRFKYIDLGVKSNISNITYNGNNNNLEYIKLDVNSALYNVDFSGGCSLNYINIGTDSYAHNLHLEGENCSINNINMNINSYFYNLYLVGNNCNVRYIDLGIDCGFDNLHLNHQSNFVNYIKLNNSSYFNNLTFNGDYSGVDGIELGTYGGFNNLTFGAYAYVESIQMGIDSNMSYINFHDNSELYDLTIGENCFLNTDGTVEFYGEVFNKIIDKDNNNYPESYDINNSSEINLYMIQYGGEVTLTSRVTELSYSGLSGTFVVGDIVTDGNTTATGLIISDNGTDTMMIKVLDKTKTFTTGDSISTGTAEANVDTYTAPQTNITIDEVRNSTNLYPVKFLVEDGLNVTFTGTPVSTIANYQLAMPSTSFVAIGDNQDYLVVKQKQNTAKTITYCQQIDAQNYL